MLHAYYGSAFVHDDWRVVPRNISPVNLGTCGSIHDFPFITGKGGGARRTASRTITPSRWESSREARRDPAYAKATERYSCQFLRINVSAGGLTFGSRAEQKTKPAIY